jgi:DNA repair protein RadC
MLRLRECEVVYRTRTVNSGLAKRASRVIRSSEDVYALLGPVARDRACESLWAVMLDARHKVTAVHEVSRGSVTACPVVAADVFRAAVVTNAVALILVHNHPSGDPHPSADDIGFTAHLVSAGKLLGVNVLDHVIIGDGRHHSMLDAGSVCFRGGPLLRGDAV